MAHQNPVADSPLSLLENAATAKRYGTNNLGVQPNENPQAVGFGSRHIFAFMAFLGLAVTYMMRVNLSVAIVDMVRTPAPFPTSINASLLDHTSHCPIKVTQHPVRKGGEFDWDSHTHGLVLGSFFWGYSLTQLPGAILARKLGGGKNVFGFGVLLTGLFCLAIPTAAHSNLTILITLRVLMGLAEGVTLPAVHHMLSDWVPVQERSTIGAFVLAGMQFGTVVGLPLSGFLCDVELENGWPFAFYVPGFFTVLWFVIWCHTVSDTPQNDTRICEKEKNFILMSIGNGQQYQTSQTPWRAMISSVHVWAILIAHIGKSWGFSVLLMELPTYIKTVLHFDIKENSMLSAMPYIAMWLFSIGFSLIADAVQKKKVFNTTQTRKLFNTIGFMGPALAFIGVAYTGCNQIATVTLLTVATGFIGAVYSGFEVNHIDVAPTHAGILMGITNCVASTCGFAAPYVIGLIVTEPGSVDQWRIVFLISAGIYTVANLFYVLFATGEEQPWNRTDYPTSNKKEELEKYQSNAI